MKYGFVNQRCPKCGGNLYFDRDYYVDGGFFAWYEEGSCLQCGFIYDAEIPPKAVVVAKTDRVLPTIRQLVAV